MEEEINGTGTVKESNEKLSVDAEDSAASADGSANGGESSENSSGSAGGRVPYRRYGNFGHNNSRGGRRFYNNSNNRGDSASGGGFGRNNFRYRRRRVCEFCADGSKFIDYKDVSRLSKFLTDRAKIVTRRSAGTCARHQRELAAALKRARYMALLPYCNK